MNLETNKDEQSQSRNVVRKAVRRKKVSNVTK